MALNFPTTPWLQAKFREACGLIAAVGDEVVLKLRQADDTYQDVGPLKAKVLELRMQDIVAGSTARVGDLRVILQAESIPAGQRRMEARDRVEWRGRQYAVVQYDDATMSIGDAVLGVNIIVRG